MKKPTLREQLEAETKLRERAELAMRCLRWYVMEHGMLPPPVSYVAVPGPRGYGMHVMLTNEHGLPVDILNHGEPRLAETINHHSWLAYDPSVPEEERAEQVRLLDEIREAVRKLERKCGAPGQAWTP